MKQKIAILTQPLGSNYGGIIQNYALQKVLTDLGHETITINRIKPSSFSKFKLLANRNKNLFLRHVLRSKTPTYFDYKKIFKSNEKFLKKYINLSPKIESTTALIEYFRKVQFNGVVVGSDQVWRPKYSPDIYNFFLDFLPVKSSIKKVVYAASFGTAEWEYTTEQTMNCKNFLQEINAVSVREKSGKILCEKKLNRQDVMVVLDPTMLLSAENYSQLIDVPRKNTGLFTYVLDDSEEKKMFISNCANHLNLKTHYNQALRKPFEIETDKLSDYIIPPIEGWLQGFRDAEFVITDSFHGTVFAIINHKPFFVIVNKERGASRFESLLTQLNLADRLIYDLDNFDLSRMKAEINYERVQTKLNELKGNSLDFLKNYF